MTEIQYDALVEARLRPDLKVVEGLEAQLGENDIIVEGEFTLSSRKSVFGRAFEIYKEVENLLE